MIEWSYGVDKYLNEKKYGIRLINYYGNVLGFIYKRWWFKYFVNCGDFRICKYLEISIFIFIVRK